MSTGAAIAIVGLACRYADARTPAALWETALASRRAFRRIPAERLPIDLYGSSQPNARDLTYGTWAAVLEGYQFDRVRFRVGAEAYRAADLAHWLALDVAAEALRDAGFDEARDLPQATTGVLVGNTLTGEFSRAASLRLRWPYVRRVIDAALEDAGEPVERRALLLPRIEAAFKEPFAEPGAETLAGGLSNTIAGRICNHFDLKGGGYTVDGACASSLLAVAHACGALASGDLDVALAGGVDLSLDPFELVGFARAGALAADAMRVYDAQPTGFWPGEGCGVAVLMRRDDAIARGCRIYAVIRGWGVSSDGSGGLTRPEAGGQLLAIERAYARAGYGIETLGYVEGHGTGTAVGDATELAALSEARRRAGRTAPRLAIGSIKANIGHTKAAAGIAGLLKATYALHTQVLPPTSGCRTPHPAVVSSEAPLRVALEPAPWPDAAPLRAGVSSMGFGGINVHVTLESAAMPSRRRLSPRELACARTVQDVELFVVSGDEPAGVAAQLGRLADLAPRLSIADLTDLAVRLQRASRGARVRAAVLAALPLDLAARLRRARDLVAAEATVIDAESGVFVGHASPQARLGFLFTGQGAPVRTSAGAWGRRFEAAAGVLAGLELPADAAPGDTAVAQPAIVAASVAAWRVLSSLGLRADVAIGHSLGELTALAWAGSISAEAALALARERGAAMARLAKGPGAMLALAASANEAERLLAGTTAVVAALNAPAQTVVAGAPDVLAGIAAHAGRCGIRASMLPVACAFHSPQMAPAADAWRGVLASARVERPTRRIVSTIAGRALRPDDDIRLLLERQLVAPVRFTDAVEAAGRVDLWIEVGPGRSLTGLAQACGARHAIAADACAPSLSGLLAAVGAAYACGFDVDAAALAEGRFAREIDPERSPEFLANPCELGVRATRPAAPIENVELGTSEPGTPNPEQNSEQEPGARHLEPGTVQDTCALLLGLVAARAELPLDAVRSDSRFLTDLHLNSIAVSELLQETARRIGIAPLASPTDYADATLEGAARALDTLRETGSTRAAAESPAGLATWVRAFTVGACAAPRRHDADGPRTPDQPDAAVRTGPWRVIAADSHPLASALRRLCADGAGGPGTIVCVDGSAPASMAALLEAARAALRESREARFVIAQQEDVLGGFGRTLWAEAGSLEVAVVTLPFEAPWAAERVYDESRAARGFSEVRYDADGRRLAPVLEVLPLPAESTVPLGVGDLLLVTGGGKGIGAECALALARRTGVPLVLLGRAAPDADATLAANLARMRAAGVRVDYVAADVCDAVAVRSALAPVRETHGEITAVLHAAGSNEPALIAGLDARMLDAAARAKIDGLRNVLAAVDASRLKLLVSFGSVIARVGLAGEAHYACANARLRLLTERLAASLPSCRTLTVEWSVWSAVGMGERLGRVDALQHRGITPIDVASGIDVLARLLDPSVTVRSAIVAGRLGDAPPIPIARAELPFRRFLEAPRVHYAGIELVADAEVSPRTDPYLEDHQLGGELLFPAVMGLEAMAQAAMALARTDALPAIERVEFGRPIVAKRDGAIVLRTVALADEDGSVHVALRSSGTAFQADHFRAVCRWPSAPALAAVSAEDGQAVPVAQPARDLYGTLLFQRGRFARVRGYRRLLATACVAEIAGGDGVPWFARYLPGALLLGDPGSRDAALHSIQASIPQRRVVPVAVERIRIARPLEDECHVRARQRAQAGDEFTWDFEIRDRAGALVEAWEGVRLRAIERLNVPRADVLVLGPYVERRLPDLGHDPATRVVLVRQTDAERTGDIAVRYLLGPLALHRRPDGRPEPASGAVSVAHAGALAMAVAADVPVGCDIEHVRSRPAEVWRDLLGHDRAALGTLIAEERDEPPAASATRVWAAMECLKKAGAPSGTPLVLDRTYGDGWVTLRANGYQISTWIAELAADHRVALAVVTEERAGTRAAGERHA